MGIEQSSRSAAASASNATQATRSNQNGRSEITVEYLMEIVDAFNRHDLDAIASYFAEDGEFRTARGPDPYGRRLIGPRAIIEYIGDRYRSVPDMRWVDEDHFVSGNRALSEWTVKGAVDDGRRIEWRGCDVWEFDENGKIKVKDTFWKHVENTDY